MTTGASALDAAATALFSALNVAGLTAILTGGIYDVPPQGVSYPYAWFTIAEDPQDLESFGRLGVALDLRIQVYDVDSAVREGTQQIDRAIGKINELLHHVNVAVAGWTDGQHINYRGTQPMGVLKDEQGRLVRSKVARYNWLLVKS